MKLLKSWGFRAAATVLLAILWVFLFREQLREDGYRQEMWYTVTGIRTMC